MRRARQQKSTRCDKSTPFYPGNIDISFYPGKKHRMTDKNIKISTLTAFKDDQLLKNGPAIDVALAVKAALAATPNSLFLCFDDQTGAFVDMDLSGTDSEIVARLTDTQPEKPATVSSGVGRPKLGVVSREVTLLPRHWEWLARHPGGASAALRKLVEAARRETDKPSQTRNAQARTDKFMSTMLGDQPGYEEAARALYAGDKDRFLAQITNWPIDLKKYTQRLAKGAFD
jgi:hypothetical protein